MSEAAHWVELPAYVAVGDLGVDSVAKIERLPRADDKLWVEPVGDFPGGMIGNCAAAAASLGVTAGVIALVGDDARGRCVLDALRARGVQTTFVRVIAAPTFWTLSLTVPNGDRTLLQFPTPAFGGDWLFDRSLLNGVRWVHTVAEQGEPVGALLQDSKAAGASTSLDIEFPYVQRQDLHELLPYVDVAFCNSAAAEALGGPDTAARRLRELGAGRVLVTLGGRGSLLCADDGSVESFPARPVCAVDTNGAGDVFAASFAAGCLKGLATHECVELATFMAAESTTAMGGFGTSATLEELRASAKEAGYYWWDRL